MRRALFLARRGIGRTSPNPCVGAVIVHQGHRIGEGWHRAAGLPHAEVEAIRDAVGSGKRISGSTLYVTLEPCSTWGRTPPCTNAILASGFHRVVVGTRDPNPRHSGRGLRLLRMKGVKVVENVLENECRKLNRNWNHWITSRTPWMIAKCAMTLDGKIATAKGESKWITGKEARREAHRLRAQADAVLVGVNTVIRDDPLLNVRLPDWNGKQPIRIILDPGARTPSTAKVLQNGTATNTWIFTGKKVPPRRVECLRKTGAQVIPVPMNSRGLNLGVILKKLGKAQITSLLVEGGGVTLGSFFDQRKVNEIAFFIAPKVLGGGGNIPAIAGKGFSEWKKSAMIGDFDVKKIGDDLLVSGQISQRTTGTRRSQRS